MISWGTSKDLFIFFFCICQGAHIGLTWYYKRNLETVFSSSYIFPSPSKLFHGTHASFLYAMSPSLRKVLTTLVRVLPKLENALLFNRVRQTSQYKTFPRTLRMSNCKQFPSFHWHFNWVYSNSQGERGSGNLLPEFYCLMYIVFQYLFSIVLLLNYCQQRRSLF